MNKRLLLLLAVVSVGMGSIIFLQQQKIAQLQSLYESARRGSSELIIERDQAVQDLRKKEEESTVFRTESEQLREQLAKAGASPSATESSDAGKDEKKAPGAALMNQLSKMYSDPEMKKTLRMQQMIGVRMLYNDLAKELGLSPAETEQLMEILADRQMELGAAAASNMSGKAGNIEELRKKAAESTKRYNEQFEAVLGPDRFRTMQRYEATVGDRFLLQQSEGQFAAAGAPLEPAQKEKLLTLMSDERAKTPNGSALVNTTNPGAQMKAIASEQAVAEFVANQQTYNQRVLNRARDILNPDQVAAFEKVQQQQLEMIKTQIKMSREMLGLGK